MFLEYGQFDYSNNSQSIRTRTLAEFRRGSVQVLVATDVAARGLDINSLPQVVNYDLPNIPENYVHRIGRTGRAGEKGVAISLVCDKEQTWLTEIERLLNHKIPFKRLAGFQPKIDHDPDIVAAKRRLKEMAAKKQKKTLDQPSKRKRKPKKSKKLIKAQKVHKPNTNRKNRKK